jgi:hypothetical protein
VLDDIFPHFFQDFTFNLFYCVGMLIIV